MEKRKVGQLTNTHGIHGECRVRVATEFVEERFAINQSLFLVSGTHEKEVHVKSIRWHKEVLLVVFEEFTSINDVQSYKGFDIFIDSSEIEELEEGFYVFELLGFQVYDEARRLLGTVKSIDETGANDVLRIQRESARDLLVPFVDAFVLSIEEDKREIVIHLMEGLE